MILPLGIFIALVWFLAWMSSVLFDRSQEEIVISLAIIGATAIILASLAIHIVWPAAAQVAAEAIK